MKGKKISFLIILFSVLMIFFGIATKGYNGTRYSKQRHKNPPLEYFDVNLFGIDISYIHFLLFFIITLGIGIYLFVYKNDVLIKKGVKKPIFFNTLKKKYLKLKKNSLGNIKPLDTSELSKNKVPTFINLTTLFALFFTFFMATKVGFTLWFFIILSYFHLINLTPKTKKILIIKAIGYPLIFWLLFSIILSEDIYSSRFTYMLSKNFIPFIVSVVIIYFSQMKRFGKLPTFSIKSPLFWISLISLLISILRFGVDKYYSI